jgi:hypothetical protein
MPHAVPKDALTPWTSCSGSTAGQSQTLTEFVEDRALFGRCAVTAQFSVPLWQFVDLDGRIEFRQQQPQPLDSGRAWEFIFDDVAAY